MIMIVMMMMMTMMMMIMMQKVNSHLEFGYTRQDGGVSALYVTCVT
jgi:hypothetical protein